MVKALPISGVELLLVRLPGGGSCTLVEIQTESGPTGWGEAPALASGTAAAAALQDRLRGLDAAAMLTVDAALDDLATTSAVAPLRGAVNVALHDLLGKLTNAPCYQVLGGPTRNKVRALVGISGTNEEQLVASLRRAVAAGFRAVSVPLNLPAGLVRGAPFYDHVAQLLQRLRQAGADQVDFVLDCRGQLTPAEATSLANRLEAFHLLWLDEPASGVQQTTMAGIAAETSTPLGWGRHVQSNADYQDLLRQDSIDVLRPDICQWGITRLRKAAALAETYYVAVAPRCAGGPLATAAALQLAASIPNLFAIELSLPASDRDRQRRKQLAGDLEQVDDGFLQLPLGAGLGLEIDRDQWGRA